MRELTNHRVNPANDEIIVLVHDEPGSGGACHVYEVTPVNEVPLSKRKRALGIVRTQKAVKDASIMIRFQNGPIAESGVNGITHEALLAVLEDRLRGFQSGPFACDENAKALDYIQRAQGILQSRTRARIARGVEGTHTV